LPAVGEQGLAIALAARRQVEQGFEVGHSSVSFRLDDDHSDGTVVSSDNQDGKFGRVLSRPRNNEH
jgi:hypothetical protein